MCVFRCFQSGLLQPQITKAYVQQVWLSMETFGPFPSTSKRWGGKLPANRGHCSILGAAEATSLRACDVCQDCIGGQWYQEWVWAWEREGQRLHVLGIHNRWQCGLTWSVGAAMRAGTCGEKTVKKGGRRRTLNQWRWLNNSPGAKQYLQITFELVGVNSRRRLSSQDHSSGVV